MLLTSSRPIICASKNLEYTKLKKTITKTTIIYGSTLTMSYFIGQGPESGISYALGLGASVSYLNTLYSRVDNIEKTGLEMPILFPLSLALTETAWNHTPIPFKFDYEATLFGFLTYKLALLTILFNEVQKILANSQDDIE